MRRILPAVVPLCFALCVSALAQRLYDSDRDTEAKQGADAAGKLATGDLWDKMARNLDTLSKQDILTYLRDQQVSMRATIDTMDTWGGVDAAVNAVGATLRAEGAIKPENIAKEKELVGQRKRALDAQLKLAKEALAKFQTNQTTVPAALKPVFDNIGDIDTAVQKLKDLAGNGQAGVLADRLSDGVGILKQIQAIYTVADQGLNNVNKVRQQLGGLDMDVTRTILLRLQADEEHLKNQMAIIVRRAQEQVELLHILQDYQKRHESRKPDGNARVSATLMQAASSGQDQVFDQAMMLYDAVALVSHGETPAKLATLREVQEEERYSIRKSAAEARSYEQILNSGMRRLALFYAGGTKPETVAQLLFNALSLANLGYLTYAK